MKVGFVLCNIETNKVLCINKSGDGIELIPISTSEELNKALCLKNLTSLKSIHERFKEKGLTEPLTIENISKLYKQCE
jgi:hypothetical protein